MKIQFANRRSGIGLIELLVVLVVLPIVAVAFLMPSLCRSSETANRVKCSANLKSIGQALTLYAGDNKGQYPRTQYVRSVVVIPTWGTGAATCRPFGAAGPQPNDVSGAIYLLLRSAELTPEVLTCPSSSAEKWDFEGKTPRDWSNWEGQSGIAKYLSYSMQNPYPDEAAVAKGFKWDRSLPARYAVFADINPGEGPSANVLWVNPKSGPNQMRGGNSANHANSGQNILFGDGHVDWSNNPFAGPNGDNIYARRAGSEGEKSSEVKNSPFDGDDNVLLPTSD